MVLIFFYPRDFSFICPTEVTGFNNALKEFAAEDTAIAGVSIDNVESHLRWARELGGIGYPLLADPDGSLARAYGVFDELKKSRCGRPSSSIGNAKLCTPWHARSTSDAA